MGSRRKKDVEKIQGVETERFTPKVQKTVLLIQVAEKYLSYPALPGDKKRYKEGHMYGIASAMKRGEFLAATVSIVVAFVRSTQTWYRVNGQHTCEAALRFGLECPDYRVNWLEYEVDNFQDACDLYGLFDSGMTVRSFSQLLDIRMGSDEWMHDKVKRVVQTICCAMACDESKKRMGRWNGKHLPHGTVTADDRVRLLSQESNQVMLRMLYDLLTCDGVMAADWLVKAPITWAMLSTCSLHPEESLVFWKQVRDGENLKRYDPAMTLRNCLSQSTANYGGGKQRSSGRKMDADAYYAVCIYAWKAYMEGRELKILTFRKNSETPEVDQYKRNIG